MCGITGSGKLRQNSRPETRLVLIQLMRACGQLEARINDKLRVISYNQAYIEYSSRRNCHSFFFILTSKLTVIMCTLDPPCFYCGRQRFHAFELHWFPVSLSAFLFCHICGRANSTWIYTNNMWINDIYILMCDSCMYVCVYACMYYTIDYTCCIDLFYPS